MSNINGIDPSRISAWCDDYAAICRKHELYLVGNDEVWLQESGEDQDVFDAEENMRVELGANA